MSNAVKEKIDSGKTVIGTWMQIPSGDIAEIISRAGFDFCIADIEHTQISNESCVNIFRGLNEKCTAGARVSVNDVMEIRKPLDLGAKIIIVPLVNNKEEAEKAVRSAKYPNQGVRGFAFCRANNWGADFDEYVKQANDDVLLFVMIESVDAVNNIDEILSVDGLDGVLIGPYDLSGSFGLVGQTDCEQVRKSITKVVSACKAHNKIAGQHIVDPNPQKVKDAIKQGYRFIPVGIDALYLIKSMQSTVENINKEI